MPTKKPRFMITVDGTTADRIEAYQEKRGYKSASKAINELIAAGISAYKKSAPSATDEAQEMAERIDKLDKRGRETVSAVLDYEESRGKAATPKQEKPMKVIPLFGVRPAAGVGEPDFGNMWEDYEVPADSRAEFAIQVSGDSMEPYLHDGQVALCVKRKPLDGETAVLMIDGAFKVKQVAEDVFGNLYLFSLNRDRADADDVVMADSGRTVWCYGTVMIDRRPLP